LAATISGGDKTARVWELDGSGKFIELKGHAKEVTSAAFSPDGQRVVTASWDKTARVWELDGSGKFIELKGHTDAVWSAAFSANGKYVVTASWDKTARIWPASIQTAQELLRAANLDCLPVYLRQTYLVETEAEAYQRYEACQRSRSGAAAPGP
jgi:WD40 repeat protein